MCDKFIFEIHFKKSVLDFSKFYALNMKGTTFTDCSLVAVDFMATDITDVLLTTATYIDLNLTKQLLIKLILEPVTTIVLTLLEPKLKALFAKAGLKGLLTKYDIIVV
jgi:uncharacterized protein YjbI with pentapeptide repeats